MTIGADAEMTPRTALSSTPFALHADDADTVGGFTPAQLQGATGAAGANGSPDTAAQVKAKLITVDGVGSGVDADLLDGQQASAFATLAHDHSAAGTGNTKIGNAALASNTIGHSNTANGLGALYTNTTGYLNTANGYYAEFGNISGSSNVFLGSSAGYYELGSNKLYIDNSSTIAPLIYGDFSTNLLKVNGSLTVTSTASKPGGGTWAVYSDERLKDIKGSYSTGLDAIMQLQPIAYHYKKDNPMKLPNKPEYIGFSAQALQKVIPEAVKMTSTGYLEVHSDPVIWTMLNAIKELKEQKDMELAALKADKDAEIAKLKIKNTALQARMDNLDSKVEMLARAMIAGNVATIQKTGKNGK